MSTFTVGDAAPALTGTVNTPLAGATVELHIRRQDKSVLTVPATITDAAAGAWSYEWADGDLSVAGSWAVEAQVTYSSGKPQTFGPAAFYVRDQIA